MNTSRRTLLVTLLSLLAAPALADKGFHRHPHRPKRRLRRARLAPRQVRRRRIRRAALWGTLRGRRVLLVPAVIAVGWELLIDGEVVLVKYVHASRIVVENKQGATRTIDVLKKDTEENSKELEGSEYETSSEEAAP